MSRRTRSSTNGSTLEPLKDTKGDLALEVGSRVDVLKEAQDQFYNERNRGMLAPSTTLDGAATMSGVGISRSSIEPHISTAEAAIGFVSRYYPLSAPPPSDSSVSTISVGLISSYYPLLAPTPSALSASTIPADPSVEGDLAPAVWQSATITRLRTEVNPKSGLEVVTGYDVLFEEQSAALSGDGSWADGENDVKVSRFRWPSLFPSPADRAAAAAESATSSLRTRVTRGSARAGSALPGSTVWDKCNHHQSPNSFCCLPSFYTEHTAVFFAFCSQGGC